MDSTMDSSVEQTMQGTSKFVEHIHIMDLQPVQVSESVNNTPPVPDVIEKMPKCYVQCRRSEFPVRDVITGIQYLHTFEGISRHRNHTNLSNRINSLGLPDDFSRKFLIYSLVQTGNNELDVVIHATLTPDTCLSEADGDKSDFQYPIRRCMRRPSQRLSLKDGEDSNIQSEIWYPARTSRPFMEPPTLQSRSLSFGDMLIRYSKIPQPFKDQQSVMMEIKYREQKKKKGKANGKTSKQKYVTMVFKSEKRLSDDRLLKLRNENDIRIMKIQEKFERIIAQLDAKIQHGKRKRQHAPI